MLHLCCQGLIPWSSWTTQTHPSAGCGLAPSGHTCSLEFKDQLGQTRILRWMGPSGLNSGDRNVSVSWGKTRLGGYEVWGNPLSAFLPRRKRADLSEGRTASLAPFENASLVAVTGPGAYLGVSFMKLLCFLSLSGSTDPILRESHCFSYFGFGIGKSHDRI